MTKKCFPAYEYAATFFYKLAIKVFPPRCHLKRKRKSNLFKENQLHLMYIDITNRKTVRCWRKDVRIREWVLKANTSVFFNFTRCYTDEIFLFSMRKGQGTSTQMEVELCDTVKAADSN